jgi:histidine kinase
MMLNSRDDINQIITNISKQRGIENIRIYNKQGQIKFSNRPAEVDATTNIKAEACDICHRTEPPLVELGLQERIRLFDSDQGYRLLGIISPIFNEPGCATDACHVHPEGKKVLGAGCGGVAGIPTASWPWPRRHDRTGRPGLCSGRPPSSAAPAGVRQPPVQN